MNLLSKAEVAKTITALAAIYNEPMPEPRLEGYVLALSDMTLDMLSRGARVHLKSSRFFPTPAEIRAAARSRDYDAERKLLPEPELPDNVREFQLKAWRILWTHTGDRAVIMMKAAAREHGLYDSLTWEPYCSRIIAREKERTNARILARATERDASADV